MYEEAKPSGDRGARGSLGDRLRDRSGRALAVSSTPTFYINNKPYEGDLNALRTAIEAELQRLEKGGNNQSQTAGGNTAGSPTPAASNTANTNK